MPLAHSGRPVSFESLYLAVPLAIVGLSLLSAVIAARHRKGPAPAAARELFLERQRIERDARGVPHSSTPPTD